MIFAAAVIALHIAAFAFGAVDDRLSDALLPLVQCVTGLAALAVPKVRRALLDTLVRYWPAAAAYALLVALAMSAAGLFTATPSGDVSGARADLWRLIGFGMGSLAIAGAALSAGRRNAQNALLVGVVALGGLAIAQHLQAGRTLFTATGETAVVFALFVALAVFAVIDALAQRNVSRTMERRQTRAQRLFLPAAGFGAAFIGLALTGSLEIAAAGSLAVGLLALTLAVRDRERGGSAILLGGLAALGIAIGVILLFLIQRAEGQPLFDFSRVSSDLGLRLGVAALAWAAVLVRLALSLDRRRRPSRGLALALGAGTVLLLAGPAATAPAAFATLALLIGMALSHADYLAPVSPEQRSSRQP